MIAVPFCYLRLVLLVLVFNATAETVNAIIAAATETRATLRARVRNHCLFNSHSDFPITILTIRYHTSQFGSRMPQNLLSLLKYD